MKQKSKAMTQYYFTGRFYVVYYRSKWYLNLNFMHGEEKPTVRLILNGVIGLWQI